MYWAGEIDRAGDRCIPWPPWLCSTPDVFTKGLRLRTGGRRAGRPIGGRSNAARGTLAGDTRRWGVTRLRWDDWGLLSRRREVGTADTTRDRAGLLFGEGTGVRDVDRAWEEAVGFIKDALGLDTELVRRSGTGDRDVRSLRLTKRTEEKVSVTEVGGNRGGGEKVWRAFTLNSVAATGDSTSAGDAVLLPW